MKRHFFLVAFLALSSSHAVGAPAAFDDGTTALARGEFEHALTQFELLADQGKVSPSLSLNRGLAYLARAASPSKQLGDLGQAAAAFAEASELDPSLKAAELLLEETRLRIARDKSAHGAKPLLEVTPLSTRLLRSLPPKLGLAVAVGLSLVASLGILLFLSAKRAWRSAAAVISTVASVLLLAATGLLILQRQHRTSTRAAVVIATRANLLSELGRPLKGSEPLSEGAYVEVLAHQGRLSKVSTEGGPRFVESDGLRLLQRP